MSAYLRSRRRTLRKRVDRRLQPAGASWIWGTNLSPEELAETFESGRALAKAAGDLRSEAELLGRYGVRLAVALDAEQALAYTVQAADLAEQTRDAGLIARVAYARAVSERRLGRPRQALQTAERALARSGHAPDEEVGHWGASLSLRFTRGYCLTEMGDLQRALEEFSRLVAEARERRDLFGLVGCLIGRAETRLSLGDVARAGADAREAREAAEKAHYDAEAHWAEGVLGEVYLKQGACAEAIAAIESCLSRSGFDDRANLAILAVAHARIGERDEALQLAEAARAAEQESGGILRLPRVELAFARVLLETEGAGRESEISSALTRAQEAAETMEALPLQAEIAEEWSRLARVRGDGAACEQQLREAYRLYTVMGATGHAERVGRELESLEGA